MQVAPTCMVVYMVRIKADKFYPIVLTVKYSQLTYALFEFI